MSPQTNDLYQALQWHLPWHKARIKFVASFVVALLQVTTVNLTRIANGLSGTADQKSNYRRIQRFFAGFDIQYCGHFLSGHSTKFPQLLVER